MPISPGTVIDQKYRIVALLGSGGMGAVYHVSHVLLNKDYALKIIDVDEQNEVSIRRFQAEAKTTAQLKHPNLIQVHDFGISEFQPYLVMDLISGQTLASLLKSRGALSVEYTLALAKQLATGLAYAHSIGVVHRDLKPENILLTTSEIPTSGSLKIVDFGIAKLMQSEEGQIHELTRTGEIFGSPIYMSPEQCRGDKVDQRTDVYSLGCVLFECLTGSPPFLADNIMSTMAKRLTDDPESLRDGSLGVEFPSALEAIVARMLKREPKDRYQSFDELLEDLNHFDEGRHSGAPSTENGPADNTRQKNGLLGDGLCVLVTAALSIAVTHFFVAPILFHSQSDGGSSKSAGVDQKALESLGAIGTPKSEITLGLDKVDGTVIKAPTLEYRVVNGKRHQFINFPEDGGFLTLWINWHKIQAVGSHDLDALKRVTLCLNQNAVSTPNYLRNLGSAHMAGLDCSGRLGASSALLKQFAQVQSVEAITVKDCADVTSLEPLFRLKNLRALHTVNSGVTGEEIKAYPRLKELDSLIFGPVSDPTSVIEALRNSNKKIGVLGYCGPSEVPADGITRFRNLTSNDLKMISGMQSIGNLQFTNCPAVDDNILKLFMKMPFLRDLLLDNCSVTPESIPVLASKTWKKLEFHSSTWSEADLARLKRAIPTVILERPLGPKEFLEQVDSPLGDLEFGKQDHKSKESGL